MVRGTSEIIGLRHEVPGLPPEQWCGPVTTPVESENLDGTLNVRWRCLKCSWTRLAVVNPAAGTHRWDGPPATPDSEGGSEVTRGVPDAAATR
jgi:hypothetical protein